jgi:hypothetical protein
MRVRTSASQVCVSTPFMCGGLPVRLALIGAFDSAVTYSPASRSVRSTRPPASSIGSSKVRAQPVSPISGANPCRPGRPENPRAFRAWPRRQEHCRSGTARQAHRSRTRAGRPMDVRDAPRRPSGSRRSACKIAFGLRFLAARDQLSMCFTIEIGHLPSCPLIAMRSPCSSSRKS